VGTLTPVDQTLDFLKNGKAVLHYPEAEYIKPHFSKLLYFPAST